jgi:hypothetical protein
MKKKLKEPEVAYEPRKIRVFHSFEEQEEYEISLLHKQNPLDRIKETVELILRVYNTSREELSKKKSTNRIKF